MQELGAWAGLVVEASVEVVAVEINMAGRGGKNHWSQRAMGRSEGQGKSKGQGQQVRQSGWRYRGEGKANKQELQCKD